MTEERPIRVAQIFNDRELALTAGTVDGIEPDDVLRIVGRDPVRITDPDTGEVLGEIVRTKAVVRVYEVQERVSLARTFRTARVNVGGRSGFGALFEPPKYESRVETLRRDPSKGEPFSDLEESLVEVGDIAERFEGDPADVPSSTIWR